MTRARSTDAKLTRLRSLQNAPATPQVLRGFRLALVDSSNLVAAEAATIIGTGRFTDLTPDLVAAFDHFLEDPTKRDKLCRAKIALAETLNQLEYEGEEVFWRGARHFQHEPVWGGRQDTAAPLRVTCALALVRLHARGVLALLVDLLCDEEKAARAGAAQALAYSETEAAGLLLRLKARSGDEDPEVIAECFNGLVKLAPAEAIGFVAEFLDSAELAIQEAAALALGDSRRREAFEVLKGFAEKQVEARIQETVYMALSLLRLSEATDFLLAQVAAGSDAEARAALAALALHRYDERLGDRTAAAVRQSGRTALQAAYEKQFRIKD
jgi:hypothetical protein